MLHSDRGFKLISLKAKTLCIYLIYLFVPANGEFHVMT